MYAGVACVKLCAVAPGFNMDYLQFTEAAGDIPVGPFGGIAVRSNPPTLLHGYYVQHCECCMMLELVPVLINNRCAAAAVLHIV
jgi:hypothetical protein